MALQLPQFTLPGAGPPDSPRASHAHSAVRVSAFFHELTGSSISDQRFMLPFITVALVSHSLGAGKHPYKPAAPFMREQTPKSLPLARFCLCDLHPHTLKKAVVTLARKVDTDGREHGIGPAGSL